MWKRFVSSSILLVILSLFLPNSSFAQPISTRVLRAIESMYDSSGRFHFPESTVANLPTSPPSGTIYNVTDGASATDCSTGGAATYVDHCTWNGSAWFFAGGGSGAQLDGDGQLLSTYLPEEWMESSASAPGAGASKSDTHIWFESTTPDVYFGFAQGGNMYSVTDLVQSFVQMTGTDSVSKTCANPNCTRAIASSDSKITAVLSGTSPNFTETFALHASIKTKSLTFRIGSDQGAVLADTDDEATMWRNNIAAMTITEVWCESDGGTPIINLQRDDGSAANILSSNLTCSTSGATGTIDTNEDNVAVGDKIDFVMVTAGGTAKRVTVGIKMTLD